MWLLPRRLINITVLALTVAKAAKPFPHEGSNSSYPNPPAGMERPARRAAGGVVAGADCRAWAPAVHSTTFYWNKSAHVQVWGSQRAAPLAVSLPELFAEPGLLTALAACLLPPELLADTGVARQPASRAALLLLGALSDLQNAVSWKTPLMWGVKVAPQPSSCLATCWRGGHCALRWVTLVLMIRPT